MEDTLFMEPDKTKGKLYHMMSIKESKSSQRWLMESRPGTCLGGKRLKPRMILYIQRTGNRESQSKGSILFQAVEKAWLTTPEKLRTFAGAKSGFALLFRLLQIPGLFGQVLSNTRFLLSLHLSPTTPLRSKTMLLSMLSYSSALCPSAPSSVIWS